MCHSFLKTFPTRKHSGPADTWINYSSSSTFPTVGENDMSRATSLRICILIDTYWKKLLTSIILAFLKSIMLSFPGHVWSQPINNSSFRCSLSFPKFYAISIQINLGHSEILMVQQSSSLIRREHISGKNLKTCVIDWGKSTCFFRIWLINRTFNVTIPSSDQLKLHLTSLGKSGHDWTCLAASNQQ